MGPSGSNYQNLSSATPRAISTSARALMGRWGALPVLSVVAAAGVLICAVADTAARFGVGWTDMLLWLGLLTIFAPIAVRLALPGISRHERIGCFVLLVMAMYLVKVAHSPVEFVFGDEFGHWRTAADLLAAGRLFNDNPLSIVNPWYPGLELTTTALSNVAGVSIYSAGVAVVGIARLVLGLALFLVIEDVSRSARLAGLAVLLYAGNPNFVFWSAQFAYESLSLPLAVFIIYIAVRRARAPIGLRLSFDIAMLVAGLALVITHHLTTYGLLALLAVWAVVAFIAARRGRGFLMPPVAAAFAIAVSAAVWLFLVAPVTFRYLVPVIGGAMNGVLRFLSGAEPIKEVFRGDPQLASPPWERLIAFGSVVLIAILLVVSLVLFYRRGLKWRRYGSNSLGQALALAAVLYFPIQAVRAIQSGTEVSNRAGEFLFLPVGFLCAITIHHFWLTRRTNRIRLAAFGAFATLIFMGGVIIGLPPWARLPGAYLVTGDARAIQAMSLSASTWLRDTFGAGNGVVADHTNELVMGSYGGQEMIHGQSWVFFAPELGRTELEALGRAGVQFIVVDRRVTTMLPVAGYYYESGEPDAGRHIEPINSAQLAKFDGSEALTRVFDNGDIAIYKLEAPRLALSRTLGTGSQR